MRKVQDKPRARELTAAIEEMHPPYKDVWGNILARALRAYEQGSDLKDELEKAGLDWGIFWHWVSRYPAVNAAYVAARTAYAHGLAREIHELARSASDAKGLDPRRAQVAMTGLQWLASRYAPQLYSERYQAVAGVQVVINSSLPLDGEAPKDATISTSYTVQSQPTIGSDNPHPASDEPDTSFKPRRKGRKRGKVAAEGGHPPDGSHPAPRSASGDPRPGRKRAQKKVPSVRYAPAIPSPGGAKK